MSVYLVVKKGWRYDFTLKGERHTETWFKTKKEAMAAEAKRREEIKNPSPVEKAPIDINFSELVNQRLDFIKVYKTEAYYKDNRILFRRVVKLWGKDKVSEITSNMVQQYIFSRANDSHYAANYDIRLLKALFNDAVKNKIINENPVKGIPFLPIEKKNKYIPSVEDIDKVIAIANLDTQDYLWAIRETMGRMSEINRLTWDDVDFKNRCVILFTRKKQGGHLTPRKVPMTEKLFEVLIRRHAERDTTKQWVFWHSYTDRKTGEVVSGPYKDRKLVMRGLCRRAGVKYFRFHALRHAGASIMDISNVPIGAIQRILGHESRTTTEIYLHSIGEMEKAAMAIYEQARQKIHTELHT